VSDGDIRRCVGLLPMLCAEGATVVWTRHRRSPDLTPQIRCRVLRARMGRAGRPALCRRRRRALAWGGRCGGGRGGFLPVCQRLRVIALTDGNYTAARA
jgi:hypothetical protein